MNHWIITKDYLELIDAGTKSPWYPENLKPEDLKIRFRLYDDDGILCYEGRMAVHDFDPLDDFGLPNAGCTELRYLEKGSWETL